MYTRLLFLVSLAGASCRAADTGSFDTSWIRPKPEVLTYRSTGAQGDGLYQVSVWRAGESIEMYINIIMPGFAKSVWGKMAADFHPQGSKSRIVVNDQIVMTSDCSYTADRLHIATLMAPYNRMVDNTLPFAGLVVDFSQTPILPRTLPLKLGAQFKFVSLDPQSNSLVPLTIRVVGEEIIHGTACSKIEGNDFEGQSAYWIEKGVPHRAIRIEQPGRLTELFF